MRISDLKEDLERRFLAIQNAEDRPVFYRYIYDYLSAIFDSDKLMSIVESLEQERDAEYEEYWRLHALSEKSVDVSVQELIKIYEGISDPSENLVQAKASLDKVFSGSVSSNIDFLSNKVRHLTDFIRELREVVNMEQLASFTSQETIRFPAVREVDLPTGKKLEHYIRKENLADKYAFSFYSEEYENCLREKQRIDRLKHSTIWDAWFSLKPIKFLIADQQNLRLMIECEEYHDKTKVEYYIAAYYALNNKGEEERRAQYFGDIQRLHIWILRGLFEGEKIDIVVDFDKGIYQKDIPERSYPLTGNRLQIMRYLRKTYKKGPVLAYEVYGDEKKLSALSHDINGKNGSSKGINTHLNEKGIVPEGMKLIVKRDNGGYMLDRQNFSIDYAGDWS
ncbi:hypothetical protein H6758_02305 [Candidatus Nomurabacteria bacterium]|nr:hypothetical protein [Candidatus Nomurabacteria bacterium]